MNGNRQHRVVIRSMLIATVVLLMLGIIIAAPSQRIFAGTAGVSCGGNDLYISWNGLNTPVIVEVNGVNVVTSGPTTGSYMVTGPGDWQVQVYQRGDPMFNAGVPISTSCPGPFAPTKSRLIPNGNASLTNVAYRTDDGGFELYIYNVLTQNGSLLFRMTCDDQRLAALQSARQHYAGQDGNVQVFNGADAVGHPLSVYFIFPDHIQINGYFADGKAHAYSFPACVNAQQVEMNTRTPTPTSTFTPIPNRPRISLSATCRTGNATFVIHNGGGDMATNGTWLVMLNGNRIGSDTFRVRAGQNMTVGASGLYGDLVFSTSGGDADAQTTTVTCIAPTATSTRTPTNTPLPPNISLSAVCRTGSGTFVITNNGGDMQTNGTWLMTVNGNRIGSDTFRVRAGQHMTVGTSGLYGDLVFSTSGGGTNPRSTTVTCIAPTATFTRTPTNTPRP